jgi:hypothetical protein
MHLVTECGNFGTEDEYFFLEHEFRMGFSLLIVATVHLLRSK